MTAIFYSAGPGETVNPNRPSQSMRHIFDIDDNTTKSLIGHLVPERAGQKQWTRKNFITACHRHLVSLGYPDAWTLSAL